MTWSKLTPIQYCPIEISPRARLPTAHYKVPESEPVALSNARFPTAHYKVPEPEPVALSRAALLLQPPNGALQSAGGEPVALARTAQWNAIIHTSVVSSCWHILVDDHLAVHLVPSGKLKRRASPSNGPMVSMVSSLPMQTFFLRCANSAPAWNFVPKSAGFSVPKIFWV